MQFVTQRCTECPHKSAKRLQSANVIEEHDGVLNESDEESVKDIYNGTVNR